MADRLKSVLPTHLMPSAAMDGSNEAKRHHGKSQSHVVSAPLRFYTWNAESAVVAPILPLFDSDVPSMERPADDWPRRSKAANERSSDKIPGRLMQHDCSARCCSSRLMSILGLMAAYLERMGGGAD